MKPTLVVLAAGMGSRFGGLKQIAPIGPNGEKILDYSVYDAAKAGFGKVVFVIRREFEQAFKAQVSDKFGSTIEVVYAYQEVGDPLDGYKNPEGRNRPWGTGQAVLVAKDVVNTPFCVINADDYYGAAAFKTMHDFLVEQCSPSRYSMVGYVLKNTLSDTGTVSRGVCRANEMGQMISVDEHHKIQAQGDKVIGTYNDVAVELTGEELVSMNFWGFHHDVFQDIAQMFADFVAAQHQSVSAEFYIPTVANVQVEKGRAVVDVLESQDHWYGVTYTEDTPKVQAAFQQLHDKKVYPTRLWS